MQMKTSDAQCYQKPAKKHPPMPVFLHLQIKVLEIASEDAISSFYPMH